MVLLGKRLRNTWELEEYNAKCHWKSLGTWWEHQNCRKKISKHPCQNPVPFKKKKNWALGMLVTPSHWSDEIFILELFIVIFSFGLICRMLYLPPTPIEFHRVKSHNRSLVGGSRFINCDGYRKSLGHSGDRRFQTLTTLVGTELKALFHLAHLRN